VSGICLVAALDRRNGIGRNGDLPWRLPDDLRRFKALTLGKPLLMGRKTAVSLGRALPGRENWVLTRSGKAPFDGMTAISSLEEAVARAGSSELMVIGGGEVYALALPHAVRMHLTRVEAEVEGIDAFFPEFDPASWSILGQEWHAADARHAYAFRYEEYQRR
jgi:dihydrofolate reductase